MRRLAPLVAGVVLGAGLVALPATPATAIPAAPEQRETSRYLVGRGIADVTGPVAEVQLMGYADTTQLGAGLDQRQWSRAFVVADRRTGERVVHVTADLGLMFQSIRDRVLARLADRYGARYGERNVVLTASHTHAGVGGASHHPLYNLPYGPAPQTLTAAVDGIVASIARADRDLAPSRLDVGVTTLDGAGVQRSAEAFARNPREERRLLPGGVDRRSTTLRVHRGGRLVGAVNWFATHPTSLTSRNRLVSGDNKGYASYLWERQRPALVAAFPTTNAGDVSPNLRLRPGTGPTRDDRENTRIIGTRLQRAASGPQESVRPVTGAVDSRLTYVDMSDVAVRGRFTPDGEPARTCTAALGTAFAAGSSEDGGGAPPGFVEGDGQGEFAVNPFVGVVAGLLYTASPALRACQAPKDVLAPVGTADLVQQRLPVQLVRIGSLVLVGIPAEPTVVAGLRLRRTVARALDVPASSVVVQGYAGAYSHYVATPEEYDAQQYEGASTLFGRATLPAYQQVAHRLATAMRRGEPVAIGTKERDRADEQTPQLTGRPGPDTAPPGAALGDVLAEPRAAYRAGQSVTVRFVGAHPDHDLRHGDTYLAVQRRTSAGGWRRVADDDDWSTRFAWARTGPTTSEVTITWDVPDGTPAGRYRIRYLGDTRTAEGLQPVRGTSRAFAVR